MQKINCEGKILVDSDELRELEMIKTRIEMKIRQLEDPDKCFDCFGGIGVTDHEENREAYIRALRWAIQKEYGEV